MNKKVLAAAGFMVLAAMFTPLQAATHMGQARTIQHVVLVDGSSTANDCMSLSFTDRNFFQVFSNGTLSSTPFVVPTGQRLVITDVEWSAYGTTTALAAGKTLRFKIFLGPYSNGAQVYSSGLTLDTNSAQGRPGQSDQLTTGFVVEPGVSICPYANQETPNSGATAYIDRIILRGYLSR